MARKRSPTKPEPIRSRPNLSTHDKSRGHAKSKETISSDFTLLGRYLVVIVLIMGIAAFLFYPDIKRAAKRVQDRGFSDILGFSEDQNPVNHLKESLSGRKERNSEPSDNIEPALLSDVDDDDEDDNESVILEEVEEDLMEEEEEIKQEIIKKRRPLKPEAPNKKMSDEPDKERKTEKNQKPSLNKRKTERDLPGNTETNSNSKMKQEHPKPNIPIKPHNMDGREPIILNAENSEIVIDPANIKTGSPSQSSKHNQQKEKKTETNSKRKHGDPTPNIPIKPHNRDGREPIILNAENNEIVIDSANIKTDPPSQSTKQNQQKKKTETSQKPVKKKAPQNTSTNPATTKAKENAKSRAKDKDEKEEGLPDDVKNFKPTFHKTFTPKKIFADGRRIPPVELLHQKTVNSSVKVFLFDEFLSEKECDGLMKAHDAHVKALNKPPILCFDSLGTLKKHVKDAKKKIKVTPNDFIPGTKCVNSSFSLQLQTWLKSNWSYSTAFYPGESKFSKIAAARVQQAMGLDPASGGKFQITSYPVGKAYKDHTDCIIGGEDKRDRVVSVLMYLNDVEDGGETTFPELGIWVKPRKGRAIVWNNMSPEGECDPTSIHAASVVKKGSKYILIRWYYYKTFYSLGKRPPVPELPAREAEQAMVMCDEYENGSCRWYDEWNYSHLLDYVKKQYTLI